MSMGALSGSKASPEAPLRGLRPSGYDPERWWVRASAITALWLIPTLLITGCVSWAAHA